MADKPKPPPAKPSDDPFDIKGSDDRFADYLDKLADGRAYRIPPAKKKR